MKCWIIIFTELHLFLSEIDQRYNLIAYKFKLFAVGIEDDCIESDSRQILLGILLKSSFQNSVKWFSIQLFDYGKEQKVKSVSNAIDNNMRTNEFIEFQIAF